MPKIVVFRGDAIEKEIPLTGRTLRIGRDAQNDIVLADSASGVSRFHAEIQAGDGGSYTIVDKNSRNGIWVKKQRVPSAVLEFGMPVNIGAYEILIEDVLEDSPDDELTTMAPTIITSGKRPPPPVARPRVDPPLVSDSLPTAGAGTGAMPRPTGRDKMVPPATAGMPTVTDTSEKTGSVARTGAMAVEGTAIGSGAFARTGAAADSGAVAIPQTATVATKTPAPPVPANTAPAKAAPAPAGKSGSNTLTLAVIGGVALLLVAVGAVWFVRRPAPAPVQQTRQEPPTPAPAPDPTPAATPLAPPSNADEIAKHLGDAKDLMARSDFAGAKREVDAVLLLDGQNGEAIDLTKKIETATKKPVKTGPVKSVETLVVLPGIPAFDKETPREYNTRSGRILANYARAMQELEQRQFIKAMESFKAVEADLPNYSDVRDRYASAENQRSALFKEAIDNGTANENANRLNVAHQWYKRGELYDTGSTAADKARAVLTKILKEADSLFEKATVYESLKKTQDANRTYQQILDLVPDGQQIRERAQEKLKTLK